MIDTCVCECRIRFVSLSLFLYLLLCCVDVAGKCPLCVDLGYLIDMSLATVNEKAELNIFFNFFSFILDGRRFVVSCWSPVCVSVSAGVDSNYNVRRDSPTSSPVCWSAVTCHPCMPCMHAYLYGAHA